MKLSDIPQEFIKEYDLTQAAQNSWIYFEILHGCYGVLQSGQLANDLLRTCLEKSGYYEAVTTPGFWSHKWRPIKFFLIVDNFSIEYVGKYHALHLLKTLEQNYEITTDWEGTKFAGINLDWDYIVRHANWTCCISMDGYIVIVLLKYGYPSPNKPQISLHKHCEVIYVPEDNTTPPLDSQGKKRFQGIVGALLYYDQAMDNKLLVGLSAIGSQ